jgi:hypothetical protein
MSTRLEKSAVGNVRYGVLENGMSLHRSVATFRWFLVEMNADLCDLEVFIAGRVTKPEPVNDVYTPCTLREMDDCKYCPSIHTV